MISNDNYVYGDDMYPKSDKANVGRRKLDVKQT